MSPVIPHQCLLSWDLQLSVVSFAELLIPAYRSDPVGTAAGAASEDGEPTPDVIFAKPTVVQGL